MFISDLSIRRPVFATVMMLALVTLGLFSYSHLNIDLYPDVEIPVLTITTLYEGAPPESVEREVTRKIEEAVNPIQGVKHISSTSQEGISSIVVQFTLETKINDAAQEARAKVSAVRGDLPEEIEEPVIQKLDFSAAPVISLAVRSQLRKPSTGPEGMVGEIGEAVTDIDRKGKVRVVGELWDARSDRPIRKGEPVVVKALDGMTLVVDRREGPAEPPQEGGAPLPG